MAGDLGDMYVEVDVPGRDRTPVRSYPTGRVCAYPGCGAVLSIYNSDDRCAVHQRVLAAQRVPRRRRRRTEPVVTLATKTHVGKETSTAA
jgi:hypothetical protein